MVFYLTPYGLGFGQQKIVFFYIFDDIRSKGSSMNNVTVVREGGGQGFGDNSIKA
jgi:hypothetical protein